LGRAADALFVDATVERMNYARAMRTSALFVGGPLGLLVTGVRSVTALPPPESADWDELEAHQTRLSLRLARAAAFFIIGFVVVFWGLDLLLRERPPAEQAIYTTWRLSLVAVFGAMYLTLTFLPPAQRHPALASAPFSAAASAALAFHVGRLGGLDRPFFNMMCASLIIIIATPASLPVRVAFLIAQSCGLLAGFFGPHVEYADTPELIESLFFFSVLFAASVTAGHLGYVNFCHSFFQGLKLERTARELDTLNRELGLRVREKTASLRQLAEHLQVVQENERGRFARELHDELGQRLSAMRYVVARTRQDGARTSAAHATPNVQLHFLIALVEDHARKLHTGHGISCHVCLLRPESRGSVRLASPRAGDAPLIDPGFFQHPADLPQLVEGYKLTRALMHAPALKAHWTEELWTADARSDDEIEALIRARADTIYHPVGSCKMGQDAMAVVDPELRVHGLQGLRVVDASVMPTLVSGNTNAPAMMIGERAADFIKLSPAP
jgi:signal transduction histidine kinase